MIIVKGVSKTNISIIYTIFNLYILGKYYKINKQILDVIAYIKCEVYIINKLNINILLSNNIVTKY